METWYGPLLLLFIYLSFSLFFFSATHQVNNILVSWGVQVLSNLLCLTRHALPGDQFLPLDSFCQLCAYPLCPLNTRTPGNEIDWNCNPQCKLHCVSPNPAQNILDCYSEDTLEGHVYRGGWKGSRMIKNPPKDGRESKAPQRLLDSTSWASHLLSQGWSLSCLYISYRSIFRNGLYAELRSPFLLNCETTPIIPAGEAP